MQDKNNTVIFPPNDEPVSAPNGTPNANSQTQSQVAPPVVTPEPQISSQPMAAQEPVVQPSFDPAQSQPVTNPVVPQPSFSPVPNESPAPAPLAGGNPVAETSAQEQISPSTSLSSQSFSSLGQEVLQETPQVQQPVPLTQAQPQPIALQQVLTPEPLPVVPPQVPPASVPAATVAPAFQKKSRLPKILLIGALLLLVLAGIAYAAMQFLGGGGAAVGTKGQITWWGYQLDKEVVDPLIQEYQNQNPDVKITYVKQSPQDYRERLTNALAKGEGPDIFEIHNSWPAMFKNELSALPASVMTPDEYKGTFYPVIAQDMTQQKGIVGMPLYYDAITLYVNEDIFSAALRTAPKTWIDVQGLADPTRGMTQKDPSGRIIQSAIALGTTENVEYWPEILGLMMYQNKANFSDLDSNTTKDVITFYQYFGKTTGNWDTTLPNSIEAFAKQRTAMVFAPSDAAFTITQQAPTLRFKTYQMPQLPKENPSDPDFTYATYWVEGVWEKSASKEDAWKFLKYMSSAESLQKINQNLKTINKMERAYPMANLNQQFVNHPILGSIVVLAQSAKSWYLADKTNDGTTGLNTQLKNAYAKVFANDAKNAQTEVTKILNQYGLPLPK